MANLTVTEIGSVVLNMIEGVSATISGTLPMIIGTEIYNVENLTGDTIGTTVGEKYQPAVINFSAANVSNLMNLEGADVNNIKLGDFTVNKGGQTNTLVTSQELRKIGNEQIQNLGYSFEYYKALG